MEAAGWGKGVGSLLIFTWILILTLAMIPRAASGAAAVPDPAADPKLLLEVQINGQSIGKVGDFTLRVDRRMMAMPKELHDLGIRVPDSAPRQPGGEVSLSDIPGLQWIYDQPNQMVKITAGAGALLPQVLQPVKFAVLRVTLTIENSTGLTLNYDVVSTFASGRAGATGSFLVRSLFAIRYLPVPDGWEYAGAAHLWVVRASAARVCASIRRIPLPMWIRWSVTLRETSSQGGLSWTRPVHMGGFQVRDYRR